MYFQKLLEKKLNVKILLRQHFQEAKAFQIKKRKN